MWNLYDKNGIRVFLDRIIFINVEKNCVDLSKKDEYVEVWFYVFKFGLNILYRCFILKVYKLLKMFFENGNMKLFGIEFEGKVDSNIYYFLLIFLIYIKWIGKIIEIGFYKM